MIRPGILLLRWSSPSLMPVASWCYSQRGILLKLLKNTLMPAAAFLPLTMVVGRDFGVKLRTHSSKPKLCLTHLLCMSCTIRTRLPLLQDLKCSLRSDPHLHSLPLLLIPYSIFLVNPSVSRDPSLLSGPTAYRISRGTSVLFLWRCSSWSST